ncbi:MAG TPA: response regulator transcription factor [Micromonosporaceae bacterium]
MANIAQSAGFSPAVKRADASPNPSTVVIADRYTVFREALAEKLEAHGEFRVLAQVADQANARDACSEIRPDILVLDIELLGGPQSQLLRESLCDLLSASPDTRVLVVTMLDDPSLVNDVLRLGVCGYLHKSATCMEIIAALVAMRFNEERLVLSVPRASILNSWPSQSDGLSERERQVLTLVARAMSNRQIANQLHITEGTVKRHMRNIFGKLHAVSRIDAVNKAVAASLITDTAGLR